jgi:hypothetical protein
MSDPPRRRRTQPPRRPTSSSSSWLPTIALGIGVVVAGLGIGAFLSAMQHKETRTAASTRATAVPGLAAVTPVARATRGPIAIATLVAHPTASPAPAATATPTPTARPSATPKPSASPHATATPRPSATPVTAAATPRPTATPREAEPTPAPVVITPHPVTPRPVPTQVAEVLTPVPRPVPVTFSGVAQNTVRRYLDDLIAGNENGAYAALGKSPGDGGPLSEEAFVDRGTRIVSMRTTSSDPTGATVEVRLTSARGEYYATYHVTNGPSGPVIDQHDYIKE